VLCVLLAGLEAGGAAVPAPWWLSGTLISHLLPTILRAFRETASAAAGARSMSRSSVPGVKLQHLQNALFPISQER